MLYIMHYFVQTKVTFVAYQKKALIAKDFGGETAKLLLVKWKLANAKVLFHKPFIWIKGNTKQYG